jgi:hypothetical protein
VNKPYHERPDWILKSIVYFCDNYTIDGKSLRGMKCGAIAEFKKQYPGYGNMKEIDTFWRSALGEYFWDSLYWLQGGTYSDGSKWEPPSIGAECPKWTDYEKRKIAKLPKVR